MKKIQLFILISVLVPSLAIAQTTLDSSRTGATTDSTIDPVLDTTDKTLEGDTTTTRTAITSSDDTTTDTTKTTTTTTNTTNTTDPVTTTSDDSTNTTTEIKTDTNTTEFRTTSIDENGNEVETKIILEQKDDGTVEIKTETTSAPTDSTPTQTTTAPAPTPTPTPAPAPIDTRTEEEISRVTAAELNDNFDSIIKVANVSEIIYQIDEQAKKLEQDLLLEIRDAVSNGILTIREQKEIEAYKLQRVVDEVRDKINSDISDTTRKISQGDRISLDDFEARIIKAINDIEIALEQDQGIELNFDQNIENIKNLFENYKDSVQDSMRIFTENEGELIVKDSDGDGLSDYDEKFIYKTDPNNAYTVPDGLNDAEKILAGINPASPSKEKIQYQDPRQENDAIVSKIHKVTKVDLVEDPKTKQKKLKLDGTALPNSFITIHIFSTPVIVTVKSDYEGQWSYILEKELENGEHEVYVSTVDNTGKMLAKSEGTVFTKTANTALLGTLGINTSTTDGAATNIKFYLIIFVVFLLIVVATMILSGNKRKDIDDMLGEE